MLTALNQSLCQQPKRTPFITCCVAIIDLDKKQMQWSKAGHPEIYHYCTHKDAVDELTADSYPLGVSQKSDYSDETVHLHAGDLLIFYTDGLPEAANPSGEDIRLQSTRKEYPPRCTRWPLIDGRHQSNGR